MINNVSTPNNILYAEYAARVNGAIALISITALFIITGLALANKVSPLFIAYALAGVIPSSFTQYCILIYQINNAKQKNVNLKAAFGKDPTHLLFIKLFIKNIDNYKLVYHK